MQILREKEVKLITGLSRVTRWRMEREDLFPQRIQLGKRSVGWRSEEIEAWLNSRPRVNSSNVEVVQ